MHDRARQFWEKHAVSNCEVSQCRDGSAGDAEAKFSKSNEQCVDSGAIQAKPLIANMLHHNIIKTQKILCSNFKLLLEM